MQRTSTKGPLRHLTQRSGAMSALALTPVVAYGLGRLAWEQAQVMLASGHAGAGAGLSTFSLGQVLSPVAAAVGALVAAHLTWTALVMLAAPRHSRIRVAVASLTPAAWRQLVTVAATGAVSVGLAFPASAAVGATPVLPTAVTTTAVDTTDAGWVAAPVEATAESVPASVESTAVTPDLAPPGAEPTRASAVSPQTPADTAAAPRTEVVVAPSDTLWDITAAQLGLEGDEYAEIARAWPELYDENRDVIGADPGLIVPDQRLTIPSAWTA